MWGVHIEVDRGAVLLTVGKHIASRRLGVVLVLIIDCSTCYSLNAEDTYEWLRT